MTKTIIEEIKTQRMLQLIIVIAAVLLALNIFLLLPYLFGVNTPIQNQFPEYKNYVSSTHLRLNEMFDEMKAGFEGEILLDLNIPEATYDYYLYSSMLEDMAFFEEKELEIFNKTMAASTEEDVKNGFIESIAMELVLENAYLLNYVCTEEDYWLYFDDHYEDELNEAKTARAKINADSFLVSEASETILAETQLKKEVVEADAKKTMREFVEIRKKAFDSALASGNKDRIFVESNKMVGLYQLLVGS